jgi:hypothetical protein
MTNYDPYADMSNNELLERIQKLAFEAEDRKLLGDADWYIDQIEYIVNELQSRVTADILADDE